MAESPGIMESAPLSITPPLPLPLPPDDEAPDDEPLEDDERPDDEPEDEPPDDDEPSSDPLSIAALSPPPQPAAVIRSAVPETAAIRSHRRIGHNFCMIVSLTASDRGDHIPVLAMVGERSASAT
ncbi:MAG: hypothetical protein M3O46_18355 [Myxococcota bacterium]|nr:hypothetical protein [Myxococcota bacterium]